MSAVTKLLKSINKKERGPAPSFSDPHVVLVLLVTGDTKIIGRQALASRVGVGGGAIRTILKKLRQDGYLRSSASGSYLTKAGERVYESIRERLSGPVSLGASELTMGRSQTAVLLRRTTKKVTNGILQRDAAIKIGASGATTFAIRKSRFTMPQGSDDCERDFPSSAWKTIRKELAPKDGDIIIVSGSDDEISSVLGALSAALTLVA
ncbi:MAG: hypothetical protein OK422_02900 [Thaumarchaeota archaeon]|nr:hypothetical protein [Nitrososphaerota archaeon]